MKTLIKGANVFLPDGSLSKKDIGIAGNKIAFVGGIPEEWKEEEMIDAKGKLAIPGFINTHTHASMTLLRSYADDMNLEDWLQNKIWPIEAKMVKSDIYWGAMLAAVEMIESGTTTFSDMYGDMEQVAEVVKLAGLRAVLARGIIGINPNGKEALEEGKELFKAFHGTSDGRISVMLSPHAPYTCPPKFLELVIEAAHELNAEIHIHLAETKAEVINCQKEYHMTPIELMEDVGLLECGVVAAHCVHLSEHDISIMKKRKVRVAHNPCSNMKLASGIAPVARLLKEGITVGLGTDGASSNNNLDMLEEMRIASLLQKVATLDPLALPAKEALKLAAEYGAKVLGIKNLGCLEKGYLADIVLLDMEDTAWHPRNDLISALVYAANRNSVDTVMVNGKLLMRGRKLLTLDKEKILFEAERACKNLKNLIKE